MTFGPQHGPEGGGPDHIEFPGSGPSPARRHGRLLPVLGVALVALAGGGGLAYVAQHSGSTAAADASSAAQSSTPGATPSAPLSARPGGGFGRGFGGLGLGGPGLGGFGFGGFGGAIHGQLTEPKAGGGYQTVAVQRGTVTDVSSSSITVRSADGYAATYAVTSSTEVNAQAAGIATVKDTDTVELVATVSNGKATAVSIVDATAIRASRGSFGFPPGPRGGPPSGAPSGNQS